MNYRFLVFLLLGLSIALNIQGVQNSPVVQSIRYGGSSMFSPLQYGFNALIRLPVNSFSFLMVSHNYSNELQSLKTGLEAAKAEISVCSQIKDENEQLRKALGFKDSAPYSFSLIPSQVIGRDESSWNSQIIIDAGENRGVKAGMTVISNKGLVGRVIETSAGSSKVLLITSPQTSISVMLAKARTFGIARGGFGNKLTLDYVPEEASVEAQEKVVVSPSSYVFRPGIPVGEVSKVDKSFENIFQRIEVRTETDFSKLEVVFVCK